jgi:hypothetical protein
MNGDTDDPSDEEVKDNGADDAAPEEAPAVAANVDNVGDMSVEINVEELVARVESSDSGTTDKEHELRDKVDEIRAKREDDLDSTYNFNIDDDL